MSQVNRGIGFPLLFMSIPSKCAFGSHCETKAQLHDAFVKGLWTQKR